MRITREKKQENHERIVAIASRMFRERGLEGVSVSDLMTLAGMTHGGFYNHFESKDALIREAAASGFGETSARYAEQGLGQMIDAYVSRTHRDARGMGCPAAALSGDAARLSQDMRSVFGAGIADLVLALQNGLEGQPPQTRALAISLLAQAVGAVVLSRACPDDAPLADEILDACRAACHASLSPLAQ